MIRSVIDETLPFASESSQAAKIEKDYDSAFQAWKTNPADKQARGSLLRAVSPVIDRAVFTYAGAKPSPSVRSRARIMALSAFDTYDPQKGNLQNHLMGQLRGIQRYAGQQAQAIPVPERIALDRKHLMEAEDLLRDELGRDPSDMEIANKTGLSFKRLGYIRGASPGIISGSLTTDNQDEFSPAVKMPGDTTGDDAIIDLLYYDLSDTDRVILDYSLGLHGSPKASNTDIARRLGLTPGAVSQRKTKIQALLDEARDMNFLGG